MHTQPNKSGSWAVEIMDVRNTPYKQNAKDLSDLVYSLGLCGKPVDHTHNNMPELQQGPLTVSPQYFGYGGSNLCNCNEKAVAKQYHETGVLKKCLYCSGSISDILC